MGLPKELPRNLIWLSPVDQAVHVQPCEVNGAGQDGEGRVIHGFVSFGTAPAFDAELLQGGAIFGPNVRAESVEGCSVFESEDVGAVEDRLGFRADLMIESKEVGHEEGL